MTAAHTPGLAVATGTTVRIVDNEDNSILTLAFTDAEAAEIARRWNAYPDMLAALEYIDRHSDPVRDFGDNGVRLINIRNQARAILARLARLGAK